MDDEPDIREVVGRHLWRDSHNVVFAADGEEALDLSRSTQPDLVVLDPILSRLSGFEGWHRIQAEGRVSLSTLAAKGEEERIVGLSLGADDYVVKPFSPRELVARVEAVLRRMNEAQNAEANQKVLAFDGLWVDLGTRRVMVRVEPATLTAREFDLLYYLASSPKRVYTRDQLMEAIWGFTFAAETSTVTVHIRRLREKIQVEPARPWYLQTVWGVGYRFVGR